MYVPMLPYSDIAIYVRIAIYANNAMPTIGMNGSMVW